MTSLALAVALAQVPQDSLTYAVLIHPRDPHLSVEARLTVGVPGTLYLTAPPASAPAGTRIGGLAATDDTGRPLPVRRLGSTYVLDVSGRAVRYRYRLEFQHRVAESSTVAALDTLRLYAVTRSLFVAPDPLVYQKLASRYPVVRVSVIAPRGWIVVAGWEIDGGVFRPADGNELLNSVLAAGPDFRLYADTAGRARWRLAVRGRRYFADSVLVAVIRESLRRGSAVFGPVPVSRVSYTADLGRKGRVSGSLHGTSAIGLVWEPSEILDVPRSHDTFHETLHLWFGGLLEAERWWTEGVTDYYAARLYAEWTGRTEDLAFLCYQSLRNYQRIPHRLRLTMQQESRSRVPGDNTELLAYRKGMLAGLLLDAAIRRATAAQRTLDDASRALLVQARQRRRRLSEADLRAAVVQFGGPATEQTWDRVVGSAAPITEEEVGEALRVVTGRPLAPPPALKARKELLPAAPRR